MYKLGAEAGKIIQQSKFINHMELYYSILICDQAENLIAINKLHLTEVQDSS